MHWWHLQKLKFKDAKARLEALKKLSSQEDPDNLEIILSLFIDEDTEIRKIAALEAGKFRNEQATRPLLKLLSDREPAVREAAISSLRRIADPLVVDALEPMLKDPDSAVRYRAASAMESLNWTPKSPELSAYHAVALGKPERAAYHGSAAVEALVFALQSSVGYKRQEIIDVLSKIEDPRVVKPLIAVLRDNDSNVRANAVEALGRVGDARATEPLIASLKDKDNRVRAAAIEALARIGDAKSVPPLAKLLKDSAWEVRIAAVQSLGKFKDASVIDPLVGCLKDKDRDTRQAACLSLGMIGHPRAIPALVISMADEQESVRNAAAMALRMIDPEWESSDLVKIAIPGLREAARSSVYWVRQSALAVLARLGETEGLSGKQDAPDISDPAQVRRMFAFDVLTAVLKETDRDLRQAGAEALGRFGDRRATKGLATALDDNDEWVRVAAANSLQSLQWEPADTEQQAKHIVVLHHWDEAVQLKAAAVDPLIRALKSAAHADRSAAATALARIGDSRAKVPLQPLLRDPHPSVRLAAAKALKTLRWVSPDPLLRAIWHVELGEWEQVLPLGPAAVEPLANAAANPQENAQNAEIALALLARVDNPAAVGKLLVQVYNERLAAAIVPALELILTNRAADVSDDNLRAVLTMINPHVTPGSLSDEPVAPQELDCDPLRQLALIELNRREDEVRAE
ncbi:MAG: HEAT repeat domain-containing protein [Verrucomicrobia bacterium]|nr:HEAT repeat domain-containing protein [Verrucomicrobiota bacterium]